MPDKFHAFSCLERFRTFLTLKEPPMSHPFFRSARDRLPLTLKVPAGAASDLPHPLVCAERFLAALTFNAAAFFARLFFGLGWEILFSQAMKPLPELPPESSKKFNTTRIMTISTQGIEPSLHRAAKLSGVNLKSPDCPV